MKQQTQDWLAWRMSGIGASEAPAVMNASPWCSSYKLWQLKTGRIEPDPKNPQMERGLALEPVARDRYEQFTGIEMPDDTAKHPEHEFIRASLDGINKSVKKVLEIKCPGKVDHFTAVQGKIPDKYVWQCVHLLMVTGFPSLDYFSFDGKHGVVVTYRRDRAAEAKLLAAEIKFWKCVEMDIPPSTGEVFKVRRNR